MLSNIKLLSVLIGAPLGSDVADPRGAVHRTRGVRYMGIGMSALNHGKAFTVNLAVEVKCKYVGHARKVVKYSHDAFVSVKAVHFVLR